MKKEAKVEEKAGERSFEEDLRRLEAVVADLESGTLPIEEAFKRFEEGVRLAAACRERLTRIEARVAELLDDGATREAAPKGARRLVPDDG